jgi:hypothetical protein
VCGGQFEEKQASLGSLVRSKTNFKFAMSNIYFVRHAYNFFALSFVHLQLAAVPVSVRLQQLCVRFTATIATVNHLCTVTTVTTVTSHHMSPHVVTSIAPTWHSLAPHDRHDHKC